MRRPAHPWPGTPCRRAPAGANRRSTKRPRRSHGTHLLWIRPVGEARPEDPRMYYALSDLLRIVSMVATELERLTADPAGRPNDADGSEKQGDQ